MDVDKFKDGSVAKLILESFDSKPETGTLGEVFRMYAEKLQKEEEAQDQEELILIRKMKELKKCEENADLAWLEYASWNLFPKSLQDKFIELVDPLFFGGIYFQHSRVVEKLDEIWSHLTGSCVVFVLRDGKNYHFVSTSSEDYRYDWLGIQALMKVQNHFKNNTLYTIGVSEGKVIVKNKDLLDEHLGLKASI